MGEDYAGLIYNQIDFDSIQHVIDDIFVNDAPDFFELVLKIVRGEAVIPNNWGNMLSELFFEQIHIHRKAILAICIIVIFTAVFQALADAFEAGQVAEISNTCMYLLLITIMIRMFHEEYQVIEETIENLTIFVKALIPAYSITIGMASGVTSAAAFTGILLFLISYAMDLIFKILMPMSYIYLVVVLMDHLTDGKLKHASKLICSGISLITKTMISIVAGMNFVKSMTAPVADSIQRTGLEKLVGAFPGIGDLADSVTEVAIGSAVLIKNAVGIAGAVVILFICIRPILNLLILYLVFQVLASCVSMIAGEKLADGISKSGEAVFLLLKITMTAMLLFLITIAMIVMAGRSMV